MTSDRLARDYLQQAKVRRIALDTLLAAGGHAVVVRESQETIELILKGALRFIGADPPRRHDVHRLLLEFRDRLPPEWTDALTELRRPLDRLAEARAPAFYGDEAEDVPPSELFGEPDARRAMAVVDRLLDLYTRLLQ